MLTAIQSWRVNVAGLIDFVGAVGTGVLSINTSLGILADGATRASSGALPLSLVPTFAVPTSLLQLRRGGKAPRGTDA